ncbi:hypothetical protein KC357_g6781 [Hortaea werneckii]|nr:hypothetical protein KC357_g6781 [Hortaea werneckii]
MSSAAEKAFDNPELLEMILMSVDMKTVLLSQRTSRAFHATINSSPRLLRKLWILPHKVDQTGSADERRSRSQARLNPLLVHNSRRLGFRSLLLWKGTDKSQPLIMQPHLPSARYELGVFDPPPNERGEDREQPNCRRILRPLGRAGVRPLLRNRVVHRYLLPTTASILRHDLLAKVKGCRCGFCEERERLYGHVKF